MIFGVKSGENLTRKSYRLSTSPVRCSHCTSGNWKKSLSTVLFIHTSNYLHYFTRKQSVIHLPTPHENVTTITCELQKLFHLTEGLLRSFRRWRLWREPVIGCRRWLWKEPVVMCGDWNVRGKQCHSKCSKWPPSALMHASSLFRHCSVAYYTTLCWNSAHVATSHCRKPQHVRINTRAPPVACPRRSTRAMQVIGSTKQQ